MNCIILCINVALRLVLIHAILLYELKNKIHAIFMSIYKFVKLRTVSTLPELQLSELIRLTVEVNSFLLITCNFCRCRSAEKLVKRYSTSILRYEASYNCYYTSSVNKSHMAFMCPRHNVLF